MSIGFNFYTVLDRLEEFHPSCGPELELDREFSEVNLLPRSGEDFRPSCLYVCELPEALETVRAHPGVCFICVNNGPACAEPPSNALLVNAGASLAVVLNQIHELFIILRHWVDNMRLAVSTSQELQPLLTLAENVMYNPIAVLDPSWKLLASTRSVQTDDPVFQKLLDRGYHGPEELQALRRSKYAAQIYTEDRTVVKPPDDVSHYTELVRGIRINGAFAACVTMLCANRSYTPGLAVLFDLLAEQIAVSLTRYQRPFLERAPYEYVLIDLLEGQIGSESVLSERARATSLPMNEGCLLLRLSAQEAGVLPSAALLRQFASAVPEARTFLYENDLLLLLSPFPPAPQVRPALSDVLSRLLPTLTEYQMRCGVSNSFARLLDLSAAYVQASAALRVGSTALEHRMSAQPDLVRSEEALRVFFYEEQQVRHMAEACSRELSYAQMISPALLTLRGSDHNRGTDDLQLLYTYLNQDRNTTRTAELLGMHRNNVIYRINRLERRLGVSLDDPSLRLQLLISFQLLDLL